MTKREKQALFDQITRIDIAFQSLKKAVLSLLSGNHEAALHPGLAETEAEITRRKNEVINQLLALKLPLAQPSPSAIRLRGFGSMDKARLKVLTSRAGKRAHALGKAHTFTREEAKTAGRIGGRRRRGKTSQSTA